MIAGTAERSASPFPADAAIVRRMAEITLSVGAAVAADVAAIGGATVSADEAADLVARHGLSSTVELALLALPVAAAMARPPISGFRVGAVGIEAATGDLVLGANLEFPGSDLSTTVHAEGFVSLRTRRRDATLQTLATTEAHPCAHCRQTLAESAGADGLTLVDPLGHVLALRDLYPWPFVPGVLGVAADAPGRASWPGLAFTSFDPGAAPAADAADSPAGPPADVAALLAEVGRRAHAPYSGAPSAVVLRLADTRLLGAGCVESVAFNPTITALQAALVEVVAAGADPASVADAWLAMADGGPVDPEPGFRALLRAVAPESTAGIARWRTR